MIQNANVISVMSEIELIYCRILRDGQLQNFYLRVKDVEHAHADRVFNAIHESFVELGMPEWRQKLIGAG